MTLKPGFHSLRLIKSDMGPGERFMFKPLRMIFMQSGLNTVNAVSMFLLNFQADK